MYQYISFIIITMCLLQTPSDADRERREQVQVLLTRLSESNEMVRSLAREDLADHCLEYEGILLDSMLRLKDKVPLDVLDILSLTGSKRSIQAIAALYVSTNERTLRVKAKEVLRENRKQAIPFLLTVFRSAYEEEVKRKMVEILGDLHAAEAIEDLFLIVQNDKSPLQDEARNALVYIAIHHRQEVFDLAIRSGVSALELSRIEAVLIHEDVEMVLDQFILPNGALRFHSGSFRPLEPWGDAAAVVLYDMITQYAYPYHSEKRSGDRHHDRLRTLALYAMAEIGGRSFTTQLNEVALSPIIKTFTSEDHIALAYALYKRGVRTYYTKLITDFVEAANVAGAKQMIVEEIQFRQTLAYLYVLNEDYQASNREFQLLLSRIAKSSPERVVILRSSRMMAYYGLAKNYAQMHKHKQAISYLEKAFIMGFRDRDTMEYDIALDDIRKTSAFRRLLKKYFEEKGERPNPMNRIIRKDDK